MTSDQGSSKTKGVENKVSKEVNADPTKGCPDSSDSEPESVRVGPSKTQDSSEKATDSAGNDAKEEDSSDSSDSEPESVKVEASQPQNSPKNDSSKPEVEPQAGPPAPKQWPVPPPATASRPAPPPTTTAAKPASRTGGRYLPPARLRALQASITDPASETYQKLSWETLKKSINGRINKANVSNIKQIIPELISVNLIRGRGVFCRSIMKSQSAAMAFTPVYAAMVAVLNTRFPAVGELLLRRLVLQFRRAFRLSDKARLLSTAMFLAHLSNFQVAHEILSLQMLTLLLENPTDDSVEIATAFTKQCGAFLENVAPKAMNAVFDRLRTILHEGSVMKRTQYMVEVLFQIRKEKFVKFPATIKELDLVDVDEQITHYIALDDQDGEIKPEDGLNVFKYDPEYTKNEEMYKEIKHEILGSSDEEGSDDDEEEEEIDGQQESDFEQDVQSGTSNQPLARPGRTTVFDHTHKSTIQLRKTIYLTIMSSLDFEECCHKLLHLQIEAGQETELCNMVIECCSQEQSYMKFYGLVGERFAKLNRVWREKFEESFVAHYDTVHRYEINRLRNVARYFGHLLSTNAINWSVLKCIELRENTTTSSSRIFVQILFKDLKEALGATVLKKRLFEDEDKATLAGLFPKDSPKDARFAVNYWTAIQLGPLTEDLRDWLKNAPKLIMAQNQAAEVDSDSGSADSAESESDESSSDSDDSSSESDSSEAATSESNSSDSGDSVDRRHKQRVRMKTEGTHPRNSGRPDRARYERDGDSGERGGHSDPHPRSRDRDDSRDRWDRRGSSRDRKRSDSRDQRNGKKDRDRQERREPSRSRHSDLSKQRYDGRSRRRSVEESDDSRDGRSSRLSDHRNQSRKRYRSPERDIRYSKSRRDDEFGRSRDRRHYASRDDEENRRNGVENKRREYDVNERRRHKDKSHYRRRESSRDRQRSMSPVVKSRRSLSRSVSPPTRHRRTRYDSESPPSPKVKREDSRSPSRRHRHEGSTSRFEDRRMSARDHDRQRRYR